MNKRRFVVAIGVALCAIVAIVVAWSFMHRRAAVAPEPAGPQVALATARIGRIDVSVNAVGRIGPSAGAQSKLSFAQSGIIASIDVHVGQHVAAGAPLATLDSAALSLAQQQAAADAVAANAQAQAASVDTVGTRLSVDRAALRRQRRLYAAGIAARKDVEAADAQVAADVAAARTASANRTAARAQARSAAAHASLARLDDANAILRAPQAGVVAAIYRNVGESVDPSVPVIGLALPSNGALSLQVTAADAARIAAGNVAVLRIDQFAHAIRGTVLGVAGAVNPATQTAEVSVRAGVPLALAGSAVSARIIVGHARGVLVPHDAIVDDPQTGDALVFVVGTAADGSFTFQERRVAIVFDDGTFADVTGVRAGERVAARGAFELLAPSGS